MGVVYPLMAYDDIRWVVSVYFIAVFQWLNMYMIGNSCPANVGFSILFSL